MESKELRDALELIFSDKEPPEVKRAILKLNGINEREFKRALALWVCHFGFNELVPKKNEMVIPYELKEYRERKRTQRTSLSSEFWLREDIKTYLDVDKYTDTQNRDNREWLKTILDWLDESKDGNYRVMVEGRISEFDHFSKHPEAQRLANQFGGRIL